MEKKELGSDSLEMVRGVDQEMKRKGRTDF